MARLLTVRGLPLPFLPPTRRSTVSSRSTNPAPSPPTSSKPPPPRSTLVIGAPAAARTPPSIATPCGAATPSGTRGVHHDPRRLCRGTRTRPAGWRHPTRLRLPGANLPRLARRERSGRRPSHRRPRPRLRRPRLQDPHEDRPASGVEHRERPPHRAGPLLLPARPPRWVRTRAARWPRAGWPSSRTGAMSWLPGWQSCWPIRIRLDSSTWSATCGRRPRPRPVSPGGTATMTRRCWSRAEPRSPGSGSACGTR